MSIYQFKKKWRSGSVRYNGKIVREIWHNGLKIYSIASEKPASPIVAETVLSSSGNQNKSWTCTESGWYRIIVAASAGGNMNFTGGAGAIVQYDIYIEKGWKIIAWSGSGRTQGAPAEIQGGTGQANYTGNLPADFNFWLGGGARNGYSANDSGSGGGGAAGQGGHGNNSSGYGGDGGAGAGLMIYTGDSIPASKDEFAARGIALILSGGGGGGAGDNGTPRNDGAGGGAGSNGGLNRQGAGGTGGFSDLAGIQHGDNTTTSGQYGGQACKGAGNVIINDGAGSYRVAGNRTGTNSSTTGYCTVQRLH